jgi:hypothetical protein
VPAALARRDFLKFGAAGLGGLAVGPCIGAGAVPPAGTHEEVAAGARAALLSHLERQPIVSTGSWARDELYEDAR